MIIEIDDIKLQNMQDDIDSYIDLIKKYDQSIKIKNQLIKELENENKVAVECVKELLNFINSKRINKKERQTIQEVIEILEKK